MITINILDICSLVMGGSLLFIVILISHHEGWKAGFKKANEINAKHK